jgi:hypothetical protein
VPKEPTKAATPQPANNAPTNTTAEKSIPSEVKPNGTAAPEKGPASPAPREHVERKDSKGLFISGVKDEDEAKNLIAEEDRPKIEKMERIKHFFVAHFATTPDMQAALRRVSDEVRNARGGPDKPTVKIYNERGPANPNAPRYGAGSWQASNRGGVQGGGYRSGGASDSEGGRGGRGGRGGSAPRGARGGAERGDRGGRGRGRGAFRGGAEGAPASTGGES